MKINYKPKNLIPEVVNGFKIGDYCNGPSSGIYQIVGMKPQLLTDEQYNQHPEYYDNRFQTMDFVTGKWQRVPVKPGDMISIFFILKQVYNSVGTPSRKKATIEYAFNSCSKLNIDGMIRGIKYDYDRYQAKADKAKARVDALALVKKTLEDENKNKDAVKSGSDDK